MKMRMHTAIVAVAGWLACFAGAVPGIPVLAGEAAKPAELTGVLKNGKVQQLLAAGVWQGDAQGRASCRDESGKDGPSLRIDLKGKPGEWLTLVGPALLLPERDRFATERMLKVTCDARQAGIDAVAGMFVQIRVRQGREAGKTAYAKSASPHYTWDGAVEIGNAAQHKTWDRFDGAVVLPQTATRVELELRVVCPPSGTGTLWLRNVIIDEVFQTAHLLTTDPQVPNNVFFADSGIVRAEFVNAEQVSRCRIELLDEADKPAGEVKGAARTAALTAPLPGKGYYTVRATAEYASGATIRTETYVAAVGAPLEESVREKSRFGSCRVHGNTQMWKKSGSNWDWGCNEIDLNLFRKGADGKVSAPADYRPTKDADGFNKIRSIRHLPDWLYGPGNRGSGLFPPKDWQGLEDLMAAFAASNPDLRWMTPFNEPNAHFRGTDEEFVRLHKTISSGVKKGNPNLKVFGPCFYSLETKTVDKFDKLGLFDLFDGFNMHAYVNASEPEGDFIRNITHFVERMRAKGKADLPLYLTEFGWCSGSGDWQKTIPSLTKAQYCARSLCLVAAQPVDGIAYFCYQIVGLDANEGYSLIRPNGLPTPAYAAYVNVAKWLGATQRGDGRWLQFSPKLHLVLFRSLPNAIGAAWCTDGSATLQLPAAPVRMEDMLGRPLPATQAAAISLTPSPVYFELPGAEGFQNMTMLPAVEVTPGAELTLPWAGIIAPSELTLAGTKVTVGASAVAGDYLIVGKAGDQWQGQPVRVVSPMTLQAVDTIIEGDAMMLVVRMSNALPQKSKVELRVRMDDGATQAGETEIGPRSDAAVRIPVPGFTYGKRMQVTLSLQLQGAVGWRAERKLDQAILQCPLLEDNEEGVADLSGVRAIEISNWGPWPKALAAADLAATIKTAAGTHGFHLLVEATDDIHRQDQQAMGMWQEDSLQVAFDADADKEWQPNNVGNGYNGHRILEYGIALPTKAGAPMVWRFRADAPDFKTGTEERIRATVKREGTTTRYEVYFPWAVLGLKARPAAGGSLGFSLALNDRDEVGGRHALRLFGGILENKNPENFGRLLLQTSAAPVPMPAPVR